MDLFSPTMYRRGITNAKQTLMSRTHRTIRHIQTYKRYILTVFIGTPTLSSFHLPKHSTHPLHTSSWKNTAGGGSDMHKTYMESACSINSEPEFCLDMRSWSSAGGHVLRHSACVRLAPPQTHSENQRWGVQGWPKYENSQG